MTFKHKPLGLTTRRQRSIFITELKHRGYIKFFNCEHPGPNEAITNYQCLLCMEVITRRQIPNHFKKGSLHVEIGSKIIESMAADGEIDAPCTLMV